MLLDDGGMVRGTIIRSRPGRDVLVQLPTGELSEHSWSDVRFAGPASEAPHRTATSSPRAVSAGVRVSAAGEVPVEFVSEQRLTLYTLDAVATGSATVGWTGVQIDMRADRWQRVCTAPCELSLTPGEYRFAGSIRGEDPLPGQVVDLTGPGRLHGQYIDNGGLRVAGWIVFLVGLAAGGGAFTLGFLENDLLLAAVGGSAGGLAALAVGLPLMAAGNGVTFRFE